MWHFRGLEECLDVWEAEDSPDRDLRCTALLWLMALQEDPTPNEAAPVADSNGHFWIADVPSTAVVTFLYALRETEQEIVAVWLFTL